MCRVIAPLAAIVRRETVSRPSLLPPPLSTAPSRRTILQRRLRIVRHRMLRWFGQPIAIERNRRQPDRSARLSDFPFGRARHFALERATKYVA